MSSRTEWIFLISSCWGCDCDCGGCFDELAGLGLGPELGLDLLSEVKGE